MAQALLWGLASSASLMVGAALAIWLKVSHRTIGVVMGFGIGALICSVCFELVEEAFLASQSFATVAVGLVIGALTFFAGDWLIDHHGGKNRKNMSGANRETDVALPILLGTVLDGIPESIVIGMMVVSGGGVNAAMLAAVFLSNIPEALTSTTGLLSSGWKRLSVLGLWLVVVAISALSAGIGSLLLAGISGAARGFILSFAGGAILTMLADTMIPEAYRDSGKLTGLVVVLGFCLAFALTIVE